MKKITNKTINKCYYVLVDYKLFTAKLTHCEMSKVYNSIVIKNVKGEIIYTDIKRDYLTIYEIISTWAVNTFYEVNRIIIGEK